MIQLTQTVVSGCGRVWRSVICPWQHDRWGQRLGFWWLNRHRLGILQLVSKCQEYWLDVVTLRIVLRRRFKQWHTVTVSESLRCWCSDRRQCSALNVAFIADKNTRNRHVKTMLFTLGKPLWKVLKWSCTCDVIDVDDGVDVAVVVLDHAASESLLSCCVPYLQLQQQ